MSWRIYKFALQKFFNDEGFLHASALTFYTLFAVVPILATAFGISKGFGLDAFLDQQLERLFPGQETMVDTLSGYAQNLLSQSSGGIIAGIALLTLFFSVYSALGHIEKTLNNVWQVPIQRGVILRANHYLALILIAPIALILAGGLKIFISTKIADYNQVLAFSSSILSLLLYILFFTWLYKFVPNTRVTRNAALFGGIHTSIAYSIVQTILVESQILVNNFGPVYGSLAMFPIFLLWVQISWIIVLYGAQLCFVFQNNIDAAWQLNISRLSPNKRQELMLNITNECIEQFRLNKPPLTTDEISKTIQLPPSCTQQLLFQLVAADILVETRTGHRYLHGYLPARSSELMETDNLIRAINEIGFI